MNELGEELLEIAEDLDDASPEFMPRTCSIIKGQFVEGGSAGDTMGPSPGPSGISYKFKSSGRQSQIVVGGESHSISHWLTLPMNEDTLAISPDDMIEDDDIPTLKFQKPVIVPSAFDVFVKVAATVVQHGYQQQ
jgi:hypothetical protein